MGGTERAWLALLSDTEADGSRELTLRTAPLDLSEPAQLIHLVRVKAGFDQRALGECQSCQHRVQILHALPEDGIFQCRRCLALGYRSSREWDGRVARLAKAMRLGDEVAVRFWQARGARPGHTGMAADLVILRAADRAFPGHLADHFGKSLGQQQGTSV